MSRERTAGIDRLHELLAERATQRLSAQAGSELSDLLASHRDVDPDSYDWSAAAADVASLAPEYEPLPEHARRRVETAAVAWLAERHGLRLDRDSDAAPRAVEVVGRLRPLPWVLAAACLLAALVAWWPAVQRPPDLPTRRAQLQSLPDTLVVKWGDDGGGVSGDVVWNTTRQSGFMRFRGLAANDPTVKQYQLWIRDDRRLSYSGDVLVDGGVFDVTSEGEVIVPIDAKLEVFEPSLFAVTLEPAGGVVKHVDSVEHPLVLAAEVPG